MKSVRRMFGGGMGGALIALFAQLIVAQAALTGLASAAMAAPAADLPFVICSGETSAAGDVAPGQTPASHAKRCCPCATLCGAGVAAVTPTGGEQALGLPRPAGSDFRHQPTAAAPHGRAADGAPAFPTGPPASA